MEQNNVPEKRALWREHIIMTMQFVLTAWLGVVHALAVLLVFLYLRDTQLPAALLAAMEAVGTDRVGVFFVGIVVPSFALWIGKGVIGWTIPQMKRNKPPPEGKRKASTPVSEVVLLMWLLAVHVAAVCSAILLVHDAAVIEPLIAAFADANARNAAMLSLALVAGPSIALWMVASRRLVRLNDWRGLFGLWN